MKPPTGKTLYIVLTLLVTLCLRGLAVAGVATEVVVNRSVLVHLNQPSKRVSLAAPEIAELVVISPNELQINGKKIGSTTLIVWDKAGQTSFFDIRVKGDGELLQSQINAIAPHDSIKVDFADNTILLTGKAALERTAARAMELAEAYTGEEQATAAPGDEDPLDRNSAYQSADSDFDKVKKTAGGAHKLRVINQIQVEDVQQVVLEVKVAQVDKSALQTLGLGLLVKGKSAEGFSNLGAAPFPNSALAPQLGNQGIAGNAPGLGALNGLKDAGLDAFQLGVSVFKPGIGALLKALETKNHAKVLAEPNLVVKSGQVGRFLAGSKIPISYVSGVGAISGTSIQFIDVGVKLNFKPEVLENGMIALKIDPAEVSSLAGTLSVNGYPIIDTREVRTQAQLREGESLILAGLLQKEAIKTMSKIPVLGNIPILGALFRSTENDVIEKELVFFITPRLVAPAPAGSNTELPTDKALKPEEERDYQWMPRAK